MAVSDKRHRLVVLQKQIDTNTADMRKLLLAARDRTQADIIRFAKKENFMRAAFLRDKLYKQLGEAYVSFQGDIDDWARTTATETAREWRRLGIDDIKRGKRKYSQSWEQFSKKYMQDIIDRVHPANAAKLAGANLSPQVGGMLAKDIETLQRNVVDVFRLGSATGMTNREMQKEMLARTLRERPAWNFIDATGRRWKANNYFNMLARTVAANTARSAYQSTMNEAGYDLAQIEGGITATSLKYPNDPCPRWAGKIISTTGKTKGYPTMRQALADNMFHPRCRHYLSAVLVDVPGELGKAKAQEQAQDKLGKKAVSEVKDIRAQDRKAGVKIDPALAARQGKKRAIEALGQKA